MAFSSLNCPNAFVSQLFAHCVSVALIWATARRLSAAMGERWIGRSGRWKHSRAEDEKIGMIVAAKVAID
jgi:hypothetical protein